MILNKKISKKNLLIFTLLELLVLATIIKIIKTQYTQHIVENKLLAIVVFLNFFTSCFYKLGYYEV